MKRHRIISGIFLEKLGKGVVILSAFAIWLLVFGQSCKHEPVIPPHKPNPTDTTDTTTPPPKCSPDTVYFVQEILPLIISNCAVSGCHDAATHQEGLVLTNYTNIRRIVRPGNPSGSKLYEMITAGGSDRMPPYPKTPLTQEQTAKIAKWINQGAQNNYCDDTSCNLKNVTFSGTIKPVLQTSCLGCHSGGSASGNVHLDSYSGVAAVALNGKLSGAINHKSGYVAMPQSGAKLSACNISKIEKWISAGAPNN